ncbi:MAG: hypothetical protein IJB73_06480 [Firmicutes bacterium]|nr:hypothetical protein [Bacillota bacterium]
MELFDYLNSFGDVAKITGYDFKVKDNVRIVVRYKNRFYVLFWIEVAKDGSISCGVRDINATKYSSRTTQRDEKGSLTVDWSFIPEMVPAEDPNRLRKITFHSSGKIHGVKHGEVYKRTPLSQLKEQEELFLVIFREPSYYEEIPSIERKHDLLLLSDIPEGNLLTLQIFVSPKNKCVPVISEQRRNEHIVLMEYHEVPYIGDLIIQLRFSFADKKSYPEATHMLWPNLDTSTQ